MTCFVKRARVTANETAKFKRWRAWDSSCAVVEINSVLGLPRRYVVVATPFQEGERLLSRHRTKSAAFKAATERKRIT